MYESPTDKVKKGAETTEAMQEFVRGTTPLFTYTMIESNGGPLDLSQFAVLEVTIAQNGKRKDQAAVKLKNSDITVSGNSVSFYLTEEQTRQFAPGLVSLQVYGKGADSHSWATLAEDVTVKVRKSLKDGDFVE